MKPRTIYYIILTLIGFALVYFLLLRYDDFWYGFSRCYYDGYYFFFTDYKVIYSDDNRLSTFHGFTGLMCGFFSMSGSIVVIIFVLFGIHTFILEETKEKKDE